MNFLKRAWFAVIRKPARSIILLVIFFAVANLVLAGIAIQHATKTASQLALNALSGTVTLSFDTQKARQAAQSSAAAASSSDSNSRFSLNVPQDPLTESMVQEVAKQSNIKYYNIIVNTTAMANSFSPVEVTSSSSSSSASSSSSSSSSSTQKENPSGGNFTNLKMPDVSIVGLSLSDAYTDFNSTNATSTLDTDNSSKAITADSGKNVCLISDDLATPNNLKVGDTIQVYASDSTDIITLKIIGTYAVSNTSTDTTGGGQFGGGGRGMSLAFMQASNKIYTDYGTALTLKNDAAAAAAASTSSSTQTFSMGNSAPQIDQAVYALKDPSQLNATKKDIEKISTIDWNKFQIGTDTSTYDQEVKPITQVASLANMIIWVVAIIGAIILALILLLNVRERMYETGVLLSMGESKFKMLLQYLVEMVMIAVVAFGISYFTGGAISQNLGNYLVKQEIQTETTQSQQAFESLTGNTGGNTTTGGFGRANGGGAANFRLNRIGGANSNVDTIKSITVNITWLEMLEVCLAGLVIILLATAVPAISIMRYKPRTILSRAG